MVRLPRLLTTDDFAIAELSALCRDGLVVGVDECFAPIDEAVTPSLRASALHRSVRERLIAERLTAAWIWGACADPPTPHQLCTGIENRVAHITSPWLEVREVVLSPADTVRVSGMVVTSPARTIADIARFAQAWERRERDAVAGLFRVEGVERRAVLADLHRLNLPHKRRALSRLGFSPS